MQQPTHSAQRALELRQVDPVRHRVRRYHIAECRSLFGEHSLLITWGCIGRRARIRLETFGSAAKLDERWHELLARRGSHGYIIQPSAVRDEAV